MGVVRLYEPETDRYAETQADGDAMNWARLAAGGTLFAAGLLLVTGRRRAGLAAAAAGAALAALDQQQTVRGLWNAIPGYLESAQELMGQVQETVEQVAAQRDKLHRILNR